MQSYFSQAVLVSKLLGLKLTSKSFNKRREPMCGVPLAQLERHTATLVDQGYKVVVLNESIIPGTKEIERTIHQIISPGTALAESSSADDPDKPKFLLAISSKKSRVGLVYKDVTTGQAFSDSCELSQLRERLLLIRPREVVHDGVAISHAIEQTLAAEREREGFIVSKLRRPLDRDQVDVGDGSVVSVSQAVLDAYLEEAFRGAQPALGATEAVNELDRMELDPMTIKSLEIRESARGTASGSLVHLVKRTVTAPGARLLQQRLCAPSTDLGLVTTWLDQVHALAERTDLLGMLGSTMRTWPDLPKLLQRVSVRAIRPGTAKDLLALKRTLHQATELKQQVFTALEFNDDSGHSGALTRLMSRVIVPGSVVTAIERAIDEAALSAFELDQSKLEDRADQIGQAAAEKEDEQAERVELGLWGKPFVAVIRSEFSAELAHAHATLRELRASANALESRLRTKFKSPNLSLRDVIKYGPVLHVLRKDGYALIEDDVETQKVQSKAVSLSTRMFHYAEWAALHEQITDAMGAIRQLERAALGSLIELAQSEYQTLQRTAHALAELDVSLGFAILARELGLTRPEVNDSRSLDVRDGWHLAVKRAVGADGFQFETNNLRLSPPNSFVHCLTGPNMAGKSTFLRQNAIIVVLAQSGSFVPAKSCSVGLVDRIFSRIGARDELDRNKSSFMVEAEEAAAILNNANARSLVLLDELGRGTSPTDGVAIAFATLEHIVRVNQSRTLFATHYHSLGRLIPHARHRGIGDWTGLEFWCTKVIECASDASVMYERKVKRGLNDNSAGLIIAKMANFPKRALHLAAETKHRMKALKLPL